MWIIGLIILIVSLAVFIFLIEPMDSQHLPWCIRISLSHSWELECMCLSNTSTRKTNSIQSKTTIRRAISSILLCSHWNVLFTYPRNHVHVKNQSSFHITVPIDVYYNHIPILAAPIHIQQDTIYSKSQRSLKLNIPKNTCSMLKKVWPLLKSMQNSILTTACSDYFSVQSKREHVQLIKSLDFRWYLKQHPTITMYKKYSKYLNMTCELLLLWIKN